MAEGLMLESDELRNPWACPLCGQRLAFSKDCKLIGCSNCRISAPIAEADCNEGIRLPIVMAEKKPGPAEPRLDMVQCSLDEASPWETWIWELGDEEYEELRDASMRPMQERHGREGR